MTGVQTCALPILPNINRHIFFSERRNFQPKSLFLCFTDSIKEVCSVILVKKIKIIPRLSSDIKRAQKVTLSDNFQKGYPSERSEERRVGKEGRSRWPRYH